MDRKQLFAEEKKLCVFALYSSTVVTYMNIVLSAVAVKIQIAFKETLCLLKKKLIPD